MREIAWQELNKSGKLVTKRKSFQTDAALERFVEKLFDKDNFYTILDKTYWRVRYRKPNNRTEIIPVRFWSRDEAQRFIDHMNGQQNGLRYEMASCGHC